MWNLQTILCLIMKISIRRNNIIDNLVFVTEINKKYHHWVSCYFETQRCDDCKVYAKKITLLLKIYQYFYK